jgi:hypothetical protein
MRPMNTASMKMLMKICALVNRQARVAADKQTHKHTGHRKATSQALAHVAFVIESSELCVLS